MSGINCRINTFKIRMENYLVREGCTRACTFDKPTQQSETRNVSVSLVGCLTLSFALVPKLRNLRAIGARHDGLPRQRSPLLPVVCHGLSLRKGFAGTLRDVVNPALFRLSSSSLTFDCSPVVSLWLGRPILSRAHTISVFAAFQLPADLRDGFPHVLVSDPVSVDTRDLSEASKL